MHVRRLGSFESFLQPQDWCWSLLACAAPLGTLDTAQHCTSLPAKTLRQAEASMLSADSRCAQPNTIFRLLSLWWQALCQPHVSYAARSSTYAEDVEDVWSVQDYDAPRDGQPGSGGTAGPSNGHEEHSAPRRVNERDPRRKPYHRSGLHLAWCTVVPPASADQKVHRLPNSARLEQQVLLHRLCCCVTGDYLRLRATASQKRLLPSWRR